MDNRGMLDLKEELFVANEFWDFLGGKGSYEELLNCFERAGIELWPEIDAYLVDLNCEVKTMNARAKIAYSINVEDLQTVAEQELRRELTDEEIKIVEERIGDYID
jgi:type II restriction endonuclease TdeIII